MPLRATQDGYAYEVVGPNISVRRKVVAGQWVPATWYGDEAGTQPVEGAVEEALVYGNATPPTGHKYQVQTGDVPPPQTLDSVEPSSLALSTTAPFDLVLSGSFVPEHDYEVAIISADGQWTYTPSKEGEGEVVAEADALTATFAVAPDADNPGEGTVQAEDKTTGQLVGKIPFTWGASGDDPGSRGGREGESGQGLSESAEDAAKSAAETAAKAERTAAKASPQKARRKASDE